MLTCCHAKAEVGRSKPAGSRNAVRVHLPSATVSRFMFPCSNVTGLLHWMLVYQRVPYTKQRQFHITLGTVCLSGAHHLMWMHACIQWLLLDTSRLSPYAPAPP